MSVVSSLDWKLGARLLLKYPALTIIGGLSLAGAIAIGSVGIEIADELLYKRLPFDDGARVVRLETQDTAASRVEPRVLHDFAIWRRSLKTVVELGAARVSERDVPTGEGRVESLRVAEITASAFPLTRVPPLLGRPLQPTDEVPGAHPVVVLGYDVWRPALPARPIHHRPRRDRRPDSSHRRRRHAGPLRVPAQSTDLGATAGAGRGSARRAGGASVRSAGRRGELAGCGGGARRRLGTIRG